MGLTQVRALQDSSSELRKSDKPGGQAFGFRVWGSRLRLGFRVSGFGLRVRLRFRVAREPSTKKPPKPRYLLGGTSRLYGFLTGRNARMREAVSSAEARSAKLSLFPSPLSISFWASKACLQSDSATNKLELRRLTWAGPKSGEGALKVATRTSKTPDPQPSSI